MPINRCVAPAAVLAVVLLVWMVPAAAQQQEPAKPATPYAERFMELFDTNHDGKVSLNEIEADQARLFGAIDVNGDKALSIEEVRRRGRFLQMWRTTTVFDLLDTNGDGKLTIDEINSPTARWFKRYDKNGDGVMDVNELPDRKGWTNGREKR